MRYFIIVCFNLLFICEIFAQKDTAIFNVNDSTLIKGSIKNNERIGSWFKISRDNIVLETITYKKNTANVRKYNNGRVTEKYECSVIASEDYKLILEGQYESYFDNGMIQRKGHFHNNLGEGIWVIYDEKGDTTNVMIYTEGKLFGKWKEYYENNKIKSYGVFENDLKVGKWNEYYVNGKIKAEGVYYPSKKFVSYSKSIIDSLKTTDTDIRMISFPIEVFAKDKKWVYWDLQGEIISEEIWDRGILLEKH